MNAIFLCLLVMAGVSLFGCALTAVFLFALYKHRQTLPKDVLSLDREYLIPPGDPFMLLGMKNVHDLFLHSVELIDGSNAYLYLHGVAWDAGEWPEVRFTVRITENGRRLYISLDRCYGFMPTLQATRYLSYFDTFLHKKMGAERIA